jgi:hypothetical protein
MICALFAPLISAQANWQEEPMRGAPKLRAVAIPAEAEYKGQKLKAFIFISGYDGHAGGSGYPFLGIYVEKIESILPESEIKQFVGPDYSQTALVNNAIKMSVSGKGVEKSINMRLVYESAQYFDTGFVQDGYFETNPRRTKVAIDEWKQFLARMSDGFEEGKAVLGGKAFSNELTVTFSGNGLSARLKELMAYCNKAGGPGPGGVK